MKLSRVVAALAVGGIVSAAAAVISADGAAPPGPAAPGRHDQSEHATGRAASVAPARVSNQIPALAALFNDNPFLGGQVAPRLYRWVSNEVLIFGQFDRPTAAEARALRYVGISMKGTFCAESQPGGLRGGFTHYHRLTSPTYAQGHGGPPGTNEGYWLLWVAADEFDSGGRRIAPGVDYEFSPTPPPGCAGNAPPATFQGPGQGNLTPAEIRQLAGFFHDDPFRGGQTPPRFYRWITGDTLVFLEFDKTTAARARALRYIGLAKRGTFCNSDQGHADFTSFQRLTAKTFAKGRGGKARQAGFWHLAVAVGRFRQPWGQVTPGVDRKYFATRAPNCPKAAGARATRLR
jgi:hypothetical protein